MDQYFITTNPGLGLKKKTILAILCVWYQAGNCAHCISNAHFPLERDDIALIDYRKLKLR